MCANLAPNTRDILPSAALSGICVLLSNIRGIISSLITVNSVFKKYDSITLKGKVFSSTGKKN